MALPCPRCSEPLQPRAVDDLEIAACPGCEGVFLDQAAIQRIVDDRDQGRAEALLRGLPHREIQVLPAAGQKMYLPCPTCGVVMNRKLFATGAGVVIDVCRSHGTFFDAGELPRIVDFVMTGGLDKARRKDLERKRDDDRRQRAAARDSQGHHYAYSDEHETITSAVALVDLLSMLFR